MDCHSSRLFDEPHPCRHLRLARISRQELGSNWFCLFPPTQLPCFRLLWLSSTDRFPSPIFPICPVENPEQDCHTPTRHGFESLWRYLYFSDITSRWPEFYQCGEDHKGAPPWRQPSALPAIPLSATASAIAVGR